MSVEFALAFPNSVAAATGHMCVFLWICLRRCAVISFLYKAREYTTGFLYKGFYLEYLMVFSQTQGPTYVSA